MSHAFRSNVRLSMPPFWRVGLTMLGIAVSIDRRRPASWITLAMGCWLGWWCSTLAAADGGIAMLSAAVLAVAAIGDVPLQVCLPADRGRPFLWGCVWACERAAWPLVGMMLGMLAGMLVGGGGLVSFGSESLGMLAAATAGALLAAVTTVAGRLAGGATAADAASLALLLAAASAAAGSGLASWLGGSGACGGVAWLLLGGLGWAWSRSQRAARETLLPGSPRATQVAAGDVLHADVLPANGPLRQMMTRLAMVAALVAMAGWLVLEPAVDPGSGGGQDHASLQSQWEQLVQFQRAAVAWALFTAAWFIGLAVPQATLQDGMAGARDWDRLFRTAPRARRSGAVWRPGLWAPRVGPVRFAGGVTLTQAAVLGWPVLVCAVLSLPTPAAARLPLGIVIGLAVAAAVVTAIVFIGGTVRASRETTFAAAVAMMVVLVVGILSITANDVLPDRQSTRPTSPISPSLASPLLQRLRGS
jgi:hypothetical protein